MVRTPRRPHPKAWRQADRELPTPAGALAALAGPAHGLDPEHTAILHDALDHLPANEREVLVRHFAYEETISEIAAGMKISERQVYKLQSRGLERLRK